MAQTSAQQIRQFGAQIEVAFLSKLKHPHHLLRISAKNIAPRWMQMFVSHEEIVPDRSLVRSYQRKKTEKRAGLARHVSAHELLRNAFRYSKNISRVLVVISHQCLTAELSVPGRIIKPFCDLLLQVRVQRVRGPPRGIMQIGAQAQEEIVRSLNTPLVAFAQPVFADELVGA